MYRIAAMLLIFIFSVSAWALEFPSCETSYIANWKKYSEDLVAVNQKTLINTNPRLRKLEEDVVRNAFITAAYARLYREEREKFGEHKSSQYLWLPAAAFASFEVGQNIRHGYLTLKRKLNVSNTFEPAVYIKNPLREVFIIGRLSLTGEQIASYLALGNKGVYDDLYWQHLSTAHCGIATTLRMLVDYQQRYLSPEERTKTVLQEKAWRGISTGMATQNIASYVTANLDLTMIEQKYILQPLIYDSTLGQLGGILFGKLAVSPIRSESLESRTFIEYCIDNLFVPNFSNFKVRWGWMTEQLEGMYVFFNGPLQGEVREKHLFFLKDSRKFRASAAATDG